MAEIKSITANFKQKFMVQFGTELIMKVLTMVSGIAVARFAGPEVVGTLSYGLSYVMIFTVFFVFGPGHIKILAEGKETGNCVATYTRLQMGSYILWFLIVAGYIVFQKYILHEPFENSTVEIVVILTLFATFFSYILDFNNTTFTARLEQAKANYPMFMKNALWNIGRIILVVLGFKAIGLSVWNLVSTIIILHLSYKLFKTLQWGKWDWTLAKRYFSYGIPFLISNTIDTVTKYSDKLILQKFTSTRELGYYAAAMSIGGLVLLTGKAVSTIFFPLFSNLISNNNWDGVNAKIKSFENFITTFIFPGTCLLALVGHPFIVTLLGSNYEESTKPFIFLLFSSYLTLVGMPYGNILGGMGRFYLTTWINLFKLFTYVLAIFIFVSPGLLGMGATGLAISLLIVNLINNLIFFIASKKLGEVRVGNKNFFRYVIILIPSIIIYFLLNTISEIGWWWWLALIPVYLTFIYGLLLSTGFLTKAQLTQAAEVFRLKKTMAYFRDEMKQNDNK